jgi:hypothetical protein
MAAPTPFIEASPITFNVTSPLPRGNPTMLNNNSIFGQIRSGSRIFEFALKYVF